MPVAEFVEAIYGGVQEALGDADIYTAAQVLDQSVGELLAVMKHAEGAKTAEWAALKFAETIVPYVGVQAPKQSYKQLRGK